MATVAGRPLSLALLFILVALPAAAAPVVFPGRQKPSGYAYCYYVETGSFPVYVANVYDASTQAGVLLGANATYTVCDTVPPMAVNFSSSKGWAVFKFRNWGDYKRVDLALAHPVKHYSAFFEVLLNPWTYLSEALMGFGGAALLYSIVTFVAAVYAFWHTKSVVGVGTIVLIMLTLAPLLLPELIPFAAFSLAFAFIVIVWRIIKKLI